MATADITANQPRDRLSDTALEALLWFAEVNGGSQIPTISQLQHVRRQLHARMGLTV